MLVPGVSSGRSKFGVLALNCFVSWRLPPGPVSVTVVWMVFFINSSLISSFWSLSIVLASPPLWSCGRLSLRMISVLFIVTVVSGGGRLVPGGDGKDRAASNRLAGGSGGGIGTGLDKTGMSEGPGAEGMTADVTGADSSIATGSSELNLGRSSGILKVSFALGLFRIGTSGGGGLELPSILAISALVRSSSSLIFATSRSVFISTLGSSWPASAALLASCSLIILALRFSLASISSCRLISGRVQSTWSRFETFPWLESQVVALYCAPMLQNNYFI